MSNTRKKSTGSGFKIVADNKKARFDYSIEDSFEAGMELRGSEVKSLRRGDVNLKDSYVAFSNGQAYLQNAHISEYRASSYNGHVPERMRRLLLHKEEIRELERAVHERGYTVVPLKIYFKRGYAKIEIALARGKKMADKRDSIKERDVKRELDQVRRKSGSRAVRAILLAALLFQGACTTVHSQSKNDESNGSGKTLMAGAVDGERVSKNDRDAIPNEVSLKEDRSQFAELRKDIPEEIQKENDELALILNLMSSSGSQVLGLNGGEGGFSREKEPSRIRDRFNRVMRKKREASDRLLRKQREEYSAKEKKDRDEFLRGLQNERNDHQKNNDLSKEDRKQFFKDQDGKRKTYFADEKDARKEFESKIRDSRKSFEDYFRERSNEFNQLHREYTKTYFDRKKNLELKRTMEKKQNSMEKKARKEASGSSYRDTRETPDSEEFQETKQVPITPLAPPQKGN